MAPIDVRSSRSRGERDECHPAQRDDDHQQPHCSEQRSRRLQAPGAATRKARASAGTTSHASIIFAWNARPTQIPAK